MSKPNLDLRKYRHIVKWLDSLTEDELSFIDSFIDEVELELEEMILAHSDYKESIEVLKKVNQK